MDTIKLNTKYQTGGGLGAIGDIAIWQIFGVGVLFLVAFWNLVSLDSEKDEIALDAQVYLKLFSIACAGLYGMIGFLTDYRIRKTALSFPLAWIFVIFVLYVSASLISVSPTTAMASSISILCVYLMTITAMFELGKPLVVKILFYATGLFVIGSWLAYFFAPGIGVMEEPLMDGNFAVRMSGLAHPNTLGQHSALCIVLGIGLWQSFQQKSFLAIIVIGLATGALLFCLSRASMLAVIVALSVGFRPFLLGENYKLRLVIIVSLAVGALLIASMQTDLGSAIEKQLGAVSKSGDSDEITTATGRAEIWGKSIQLIKERPMLGYGPTTSKFLLEEYSLYTHNLWLNIGLSCGIAGLLIGLLMCLARIRMMFSSHCFVADGIVTFILINGLFENVIFSNLCGVPTICWIVGLGWFQFDNNEFGDL